MGRLVTTGYDEPYRRVMSCFVRGLDRFAGEGEKWDDAACALVSDFLGHMQRCKRVE